MKPVNHVTRAARCRVAAVATALAAALPAAAAGGAGTPFAAPLQPALPGPTGGLLRVVLSLALVLAAVLASSWLMRRMRGISAGGARGIEVLAQASLGARERAVLVRVGGHELLLGVAAGSVRTLIVLGDSVAVAADAAAPPPPTAASPTAPPSFATAFKTLLSRSLGK